MMNFSGSPLLDIFQFHKGTIRTQKSPAKEKAQIYFNSIKVRLEQANIGAVILSRQAFQFHKGTIRTRLTRCTPWGLPNFNSIKVRLEPYKVYSHCHQYNSIP